MKEKLLEVKYYETYYFANIINNILEDTFPYLRKLDEFYCDDNYLILLEAFPKYSAFHKFVELIIDDLLFEKLDEVNFEKTRENEQKFAFIPDEVKPNFRTLPVNEALDYHGIEHGTFEEWLCNEKGKSFFNADEDDAYDYYIELRLTGILDKLLDKMVSEVFYLMFLNRQVMVRFNEMIANVINQICIDDLSDENKSFFAKDGVLIRKNPPKWVKKAVFYRDRGRCVLCKKDISGLTSIDSNENFDHIVPLASGGINDISNIQLLCETCNKEKLAGEPITSLSYESWY